MTYNNQNEDPLVTKVKELLNKGLVRAREADFEGALKFIEKALEIQPESIDAIVFKGKVLLTVKKVNEAKECAEKALNINEESDKVWELKGLLLDESGKFDEAIEALDNAISINPKEPGNFLSKANVFMNHQDPQNALKCFNQALDIQQDSIPALFGKTIILASQGKFDEALPTINKLIEGNPDNLEAKRLKAMILRESGRGLEAIDTIDKITSQDPTNIKAWIEKGIELLNIKKPDDALSCFSKAIELSDKSVEAWTLKGVALRILKRYEEAMKCFDTAISIDAKNYKPLLEKGQLLIDLKKIDLALDLYDHTLKRFPDAFDIHFAKGLAYGSKDDFTEAIKCFDKALELNPQFQPADEARSIAKEMLRFKPPKEDLKKMILSEPTDAIGFYNKAFALLNAGDKEKALEMYDEALKLKPDFIQAVHNKGAILADLNRLDEALEITNIGLNYVPEDISLLSNKAAVLLKLEKFDESIKIIDKVLEINPNYVNAWINKGLSFHIRGDTERGLKYLDRAIEVDPNSDKAWYNKSILLNKLGRKDEAQEAKQVAIRLNPALDKKDIVAIIDSRSFFGKRSDQTQEDSGGYICHDCGKPVKMTEKFCSSCGAPLGKSDSNIPVIHFGSRGPSMGTINVKELDQLGIPPSDAKVKPFDPSEFPSPEDTMKFLELSDRGTSLAQQGELEDAVKYYDKALELLPHAWMTLMMKSSVLLEAEKDEEVLKTTEELLSYHPNVPEGWYIRGLALINTDNPDDGLRCLQNALKIDPRMEPAQKAIDNLFQTHPNNAEYYFEKLQLPIRRTYELMHNIFSKVKPNEWISFVPLEITIDGFVENAILKKYEIEFKQEEFNDYLPKLVYYILKTKNYFIFYVGKLNSQTKRILLLGYAEKLFGLDMITSIEKDKNPLKIYPIYEEIVDAYEKIQNEWEFIWEGEFIPPLYLFYNLIIYEEYLDKLRIEFS
ncbi:MAG: tetratricopeptide repeat protein [Candidatus Hermodarchaeota archaeon]